MKAESKVPNPYSFPGQYIAGSWRPGRHGKVIQDANPFDGKVLLEVIGADKTDLDEAYQAARTAQVAWENMLPGQKTAILRNVARIMRERKDEIVSWLVKEVGSTIIKATIEADMTVAGMEEVAAYPYRVEGKIVPCDDEGTETRIYRRPIGVIGVISPWNFPFYLSNRSVATALAVGNAVVLKPSQTSMVTGGLLLARIYEEAGLPPGVLNVIVGSSSEIGDAFVTNPIAGFISFTGSTSVGRHVAQLCQTGKYIKGVALELGGSSPLVVLDDADIDMAVGATILGRFLHQGMICMSTNRVIVDAKVYDQFMEAFVPRVKALKYGDPNEPGCLVGPMVNQDQFNLVIDQIKLARKEGATEVLGGEPVGMVIPPHIFTDVVTDMKIAQQEVFGPVITVFKVNGDEEALRVCNDTDFGLSSSVFTQNEARGVSFARRVEAGMTHINDMTVCDYPNTMFGGEKNSGIGRFGGEWIISEFTRDHLISVKRTKKQYPF